MVHESGPRGRRLASCCTSIHSRHLFRLFLVRFGWVFLYLQLFLGLSAILLHLWMHPYLPALRLLLAFPDLVLLLLPLSLSFAALIGGLLFLSAVRSHRGFLAIRLAGRDPRFFQIPIVLFGAALSLVLGWLNGAVIPAIQYQVRHPRIEDEEATRAIPLQILRQKNRFLGARFAFEGLEGGELKNVSLSAPRGGPAAVITARRAGFRFSGAPPSLTVVLRSGRMLEVDDRGRLTQNLGFDRFDLTLAPEGLLHRSKTEILPLRYYTNAELDRLPAQRRLMLDHGIRLTTRQQEHVAAIPFMRAARTVLAGSPLLFLALLVLVLGGQAEAPPRGMSAVVAVACLLVFLPQAYFFTQTPVRTGPLAHSGAALLPVIETGLLLGVAVLVARLRGRRRA